MDLRKTPRWFYFLIAFLALLILALGIWWLYLLTMFAKTLGPEQAKLLHMLKWEGTAFLLLLLICGVSVAILYWRDLQKTRALQALFASLTHELKTPLASMRLQSEVIRDLIRDESHDHEQLNELATRLIQDTIKLEHELDKGLQLSLVEGQNPPNLSPVSLHRFVRKLAEKCEVPVRVQGEGTVLADEMALTMIFRNLFENSLRHHPKLLEIIIEFKHEGDQLICTYNDQGAHFLGERHKLGQLFYKHDSKKGTGIGLYLVKQLMRTQQGQLGISEQGPLIFLLRFKKVEDMT